MGISDVKDDLKGVFSLIKDAKLVRKSMIIKYCACIIIIFTFFYSIYWDVMQYIDLPMAPRLSRLIRMMDLVYIMITWVVIYVVKCLIRNLFIVKLEIKFEEKEIMLKYYFCETVVDFFMSIVTLLAAVNMFIEYLHGVSTSNIIVFWGAVIFLVFSFLKKHYILFTHEFRKITR